MTGVQLTVISILSFFGLSFWDNRNVVSNMPELKAQRKVFLLQGLQAYPDLKPECNCCVFLILWLCILHCGEKCPKSSPIYWLKSVEIVSDTLLSCLLPFSCNQTWPLHFRYKFYLTLCLLQWLLFTSSTR